MDNVSGVESSCDQWIFDQSVFESTVRSQFGLVCDNEWQVSLGSTLYMLGLLVGSLMFGVLSDKFGRFSMLMVASAVTTIAAFGGAFVPYFWAYNLLRFFIGLSAAGNFVTLNTYVSEISTQSQRLRHILIIFLGYSSGGISLCCIAYFQRNHFTIQIICACLWLPMFLFPLLLTESPRWLVIRGYTKKAWFACLKITKINRRKFMDREEFDKLCQNALNECPEKNQSIFKIIRFSGLRRVSFVVWYCFGVASFVYYILSFGSGSFGNNVFMNFGLMCAFEFLGIIGVYFIANKYGTVKLMIISYLCAGVFILICGGFYGNLHLSIPLTVFSLAGRVCIGITFELIWVYSLDIYPTVARTSGVGAASMCSRISSLLSPQMENLLNVWPPLPFIITGILPLLAGILAWRFLPETLKMRTKDYLEETEEFIRNSENACCSRNCLTCRTLNDLEIEVQEEEETEKLKKEEEETEKLKKEEEETEKFKKEEEA